MKLLKYATVLLCCLMIWGCSKGNNDAPPVIDPSTGKHIVPNWRQESYTSAQRHGGLEFGAAKDMASCQECHGRDFAGGISKVSCLNTAGCHGAAVSAPHPAGPWRGGTRTHTVVKEANASTCAICHARTPKTDPPGCFNNSLCHGVVGHAADPQPWLNPANHGANPQSAARPGAKFSIEACRSCHATTATGANPLFTKPLGSMAAGCSSAGCHDQNVRLAHPYVWLPGRVAGINTDHRTAKDLVSSCGLCHGASLDGAGGVAPSCMGTMVFGGVTIRCHANTTMATSPVYVQCTSCHGGAPSGPNGASAPNTAGAHAKHTVVTAGTCTLCHGSSTSGSSTHADGTTFFVATISGGSFNTVTKTCSNTVCHGGSGTTTPVWSATGGGCAVCHGTPPNGVVHPNNAGSHANHVIFAAGDCSACHNGAGSGTALHANGTTNISISSTYQAETGGAASYNSTTGRCANITCHGGTNPNSVNTTPDWNAGAANLLADCYNCHGPANNTIPALPAAYAPSPVTPQYNSFWSGDGRARGHVLGNSYHTLHLGLGNGLELDFTAFGGIVCTDCHDATLLASSHFSGLNTPAIVGAESSIIGSFGYTVGNNWTCAAGTCHGRTDGAGNRSWK